MPLTGRRRSPLEASVPQDSTTPRVTRTQGEERRAAARTRRAERECSTKKGHVVNKWNGGHEMRIQFKKPRLLESIAALVLLAGLVVGAARQLSGRYSTLLQPYVLRRVGV